MSSSSHVVPIIPDVLVHNEGTGSYSALSPPQGKERSTYCEATALPVSCTLAGRQPRAEGVQLMACREVRRGHHVRRR